MAEASGKSGYVKEGSNTIAGIKNWTCPQLAGVGDITDFESSGLKEFILLLKEWSGNFDGSWDGAPLTLGSSYTLHLGLNGSHEYYGSAIIKGINPGVAVDGVNTISYDFQGTGSITYS